MGKYRIPGRGSWPEVSRISEVLRRETVGGFLLIGAALIALIWANLGDSYSSLRDTTFGPESLQLNLSLEQWASDGLLAIFFFVAGLELKREFVAGDLREPSRAALPIMAAVGGMVVPAAIFVFINWGGSLAGWAIPSATDIAFALAVLAVISTHLPIGLRTFLLTLAVIDDLLAIMIIAIFYTDALHLGWLALALVPLALFAFSVQRGIRRFWLLVPLAVTTWGLVHASGIHATVAGVLLGFMVPVLNRRDAEEPGMAQRFEHVMRPLSAGVAVPVFAFFAAGVAVGSWSDFGRALTEPITLGVMAGLFIGKTIGVTGTAWLMTKLTRAELDDDIAWIDMVGLAMLAGVGFTVSLLIGSLAYGAGTVDDDHVKTGVLVGSFVSAAAASFLLRTRNRHYRRVAIEEARDDNADGIPDIYQS